MNSALSSLACHWRPSQSRKFNGIEELQLRVAQHYGLKVSELRSGRKSEMVAARSMAFLLCRNRGFSYPQIGRAFECHHTTVVVAVGKMAHLAMRHSEVAADLEKLKGAE